MPRLSELRGQARQSQQGQQQQGTQGQQYSIRTAVTYPQPVEGLFNGEPVTIIATGDIVGMSPAVQIVDQDGQIDWASSDEVTVTDRTVLPQDEQRRSRLLKHGRQQQQFQNQ